MRRVTWYLGVLSALCFVSPVTTPLEAQRSCKTGCPCGNSCISCSKTCRIGTTRPSTPTRTPPAPATSEPSKAFALMPLAAVPAIALDTATGWVGSGLNRLYFKRSCALAPLLVPSDRLLADDTTFFASQGWKRLLATGC